MLKHENLFLLFVCSLRNMFIDFSLCFSLSCSCFYERAKSTCQKGFIYVYVYRYKKKICGAEKYV